MATYAPGVYPQSEVLVAPPVLATGCPVILGYASDSSATPPLSPEIVTSPAGFAAKFAADASNGYLAETVEAFFANGGQLAYVVRLRTPAPGADPLATLVEGLQAASELDVDLVCAPDVVRQRGLGEGVDAGSLLPPLPDDVAVMQSSIIADCERLGTRVAILDALPMAALGGVGQSTQSTPADTVDLALQQQVASLDGSPDAALYHPWIASGGSPGRFIPPCGAVAGVIARSDRQTGVHKAPANEPIMGIVDVEDAVTAARQLPLNEKGVNCIRVFAGRGILVWGARTVSSDPAWQYLNARRVVLTTARWAAQALEDVVFEPADVALWARVTRLVNSYLTTLYDQGALVGVSAPAAFAVTCDATTNPPEVRDLGQLVLDIRMNLGPPNEVVLIRLIRDATGVTIESSSSPG